MNPRGENSDFETQFAGDDRILPFEVDESGVAAVTTQADEAPALRLTQLFHRLNRVLPESQAVLTILPTETVEGALTLMRKHGFSQLPVVLAGEVLGVFSHRSFCEAAIKLKGSRVQVGELAVEEFMERPRFARITDEFVSVFDDLDKMSAVLLGEPDRLQGVITSMDVLRYLYGVANPYVMVAEIEVSLRALIRLAVDAPALEICCNNSLKSAYKEADVPTEVERMTFNDYIQLISHGQNWPHFVKVLGGSRETTRVKLLEVRDLRNDVFHFRRELTMEDHEKLASHRDWLLRKARIVDLAAVTGGAR